MSGDIQQNGEVQNFGHEGGAPTVHPLVRNPDPSIRNTLRSVFDLLTVIILKRVREREYFFQSNKFTAFKIKDGKEVAKSMEDYPSISS